MLGNKKKIVEATICEIMSVEPMLMVDPTKRYEEHAKSHTNNFSNLAIKTYTKFPFFQSSHIVIKFLLFSHNGSF